MLKFLAKIKKIAVFNSILSIMYILFILQPAFAADTGEMACKRAGAMKEDTFMNIQTAAFETIDNMLPIKPQQNAKSIYLTLSLNNYINMHKVLFGFQDYISLYSNIYNLSELLKDKTQQRTIRDIIVGIYNNDKIPLITSTIASLMPGAYVYSQIGSKMLEQLKQLNLTDKSISNVTYTSIVQKCIDFHDNNEHPFIDRYRYTILLILAYIDIVTSNKSITSAEQEDVVKISKALSFKPGL